MKKKIYCYFCGTKLKDAFSEGRIRRFCDNCQEPIYENPVPATCLVVINKSEQVLLVKRNVPPQVGFWCLPGGFIELEETPGKSALRELKEETGLSGKIQSLQGVISHPNSLYNTVIIICYLVKSFSGTLIAGDDASDASFFHKSNLPEIAFKSHEEFINNYFYK